MGTPMIASKNVCLPRKEGELDVKQIGVWNDVAMCKYTCLPFEDRESLWVKWVEEIYLKSGSIWQVDIRNDSPCSRRKILQLRPIMITLSA
ncbi:hypothetical protein SLA2020_358330 [Shorea laevis]